MNKPLNITLDLPSEWLEKIESLAEEKQQSLTILITDIISEYLGYNSQHNRLDRLEKQSEDLIDRLIILESKNHDIENLKHRFDIMEKLIASLQSQVISRSFETKIYPNIIQEEIEDEPDEILTDFLD